MGRYQRYKLQWQGLDIEVLHCPDWLDTYAEIYGYALAHLEVRTIGPEGASLPITETGYRSHFTRADLIEAAGGPVSFVLAWLDEAAQSPEWKEQQSGMRQYALF